ncbi:hypothetical protein RAA17_12220 [Komagataeibacter rhaeticus]|nr:hypothetical protein [Komagataeibacter rhaeticus]
MADIVSISHAIVAQMAAIVYPDGKGQPSVTGGPPKSSGAGSRRPITQVPTAP